MFLIGKFAPRLFEVTDSIFDIFKADLIGKHIKKH